MNVAVVCHSNLGDTLIKEKRKILGGSVHDDNNDDDDDDDL